MQKIQINFLFIKLQLFHLIKSLSFLNILQLHNDNVKVEEKMF